MQFLFVDVFSFTSIRFDEVILVTKFVWRRAEAIFTFTDTLFFLWTFFLGTVFDVHLSRPYLILVVVR